MRHYKVLGLLFALFWLVSGKCLGETVTFRPGPEDGIDMWYSSYYSYNGSHFVDDSKLQVGGWGDNYWTLIRFDLGCLPKQATRVVMYLMPYSRGDSSTPVSMKGYLLTTPWDEKAGWSSTPSGYDVGTVGAPTPGTWYGIDITNIYNGWQAGTYANWGFALTPTAIDNRFNVFRSSDYTGDETQRPKLIVEYTPNPSEPFKLCFPLKREGDNPYQTEVSAIMDHNAAAGIVETYDGESGSENPYTYGQGVVGYQKQTLADFSVPLLNYKDGVSSSGRKWLFYDGHTGYDYPAPLGLQVYATATGVARRTGDKYNTLIIDHGNGYSTYYLHMSQILVSDGQRVTKGALVGKVGMEGASAYHLHVTIMQNNTRIDPYGYAGVNGILWDE